MVDNAEKGLARACAATGAQVLEYSAAPVFMDANAKCRHQWLIEFSTMPDSLENFRHTLDKHCRISILIMKPSVIKILRCRNWKLS